MIVQGPWSAVRMSALAATCVWWLAGCVSNGSVDNDRSNGDVNSARLDLADYRGKAWSVVLAASRSDNPFVRANAIEAAEAVPSRLAPLVQLGLSDRHAAVRFSALFVMGKHRLRDLAGTAETLLTDERNRLSRLKAKLDTGSISLGDRQLTELRQSISESRSVIAAALFALKLCGKQVDLSPLAVYLAADDPHLRGNVAMLVGHMRDPTAAPMLKELARVPMPRHSAEAVALVRVQFAEATIRLGDDSALDALRAAAFSPFHEVRVVAIEAMGQLYDRRMHPALRKIMLDERNNQELRLAAAMALGPAAGLAGLQVAQAAATSQTPAFRSLAARTLGAMRTSGGQQILVGLLDDSDERVRLSAAAAVLLDTRGIDRL